MSSSFFTNPAMLATPAVLKQDLPEGGFILTSPEPLGSVTRCIGDWLEHWARTTPNALFLAERGPDGEWVKLTYAQTRDKIGAIAQA